MSERVFPVHRDPRGELVVVEGEDVGFAVRRVFTVSGLDGGGTRGGHLAGCTELLVLVTGSAAIRVRRAGETERSWLLDAPGQSVTIREKDHVEYDLGGAGSVLLVLCDAPYEAR